MLLTIVGTFRTPSVLARRAWPRLAILTVLTLVAGWWIFTEAIADRDARARPEAALRWRPGHPHALARLAEQRLAAGDFAQAEALARRALAADPLEFVAFRTLALAAEARGDTPAASRLITIAARREKRDVAIQTLVFSRRRSQGRFDEAAAAADALFRAWPQTQREPMTDALRQLASEPGGPEAVARTLASDPPWRTRFLFDLSRGVSDPAALFSIFTALKAGPRPPTEIETQVYIVRFVREGRLEEAFLAWTQLLPTQALKGLGDLYDGGFDGAPGPPPFNWQFFKPKGVVVEIVGAPSERGGGMLLVTFSGARSRPLLARQLLVLPPGRYVLSGEVNTEGLETPWGLRWRLRCANPPKALLAETEPLIQSTGWRSFTTVIELALDACTAQWLSLELGGKVPAERRVAGKVWFDNLRITRPGLLPVQANNSP